MNTAQEGEREYKEGRRECETDMLQNLSGVGVGGWDIGIKRKGTNHGPSGRFVFRTEL